MMCSHDVKTTLPKATVPSLRIALADHRKSLLANLSIEPDIALTSG
jgi:hypothetical protein